MLLGDVNQELYHWDVHHEIEIRLKGEKATEPVAS